MEQIVFVHDLFLNFDDNDWLLGLGLGAPSRVSTSDISEIEVSEIERQQPGD
jgi:hypothetical protein